LNDKSAQQLNVNCDPKRKERSFLNKDNLQDARDKGAFVPSSTQHKVEGYEGFASNTANINHPNDSEEINEKKNLFSRMSANFSRMTTSDSSIDIPAILRRGDNKSEG
jgi:hypothetical protein